MLKQIFIVLILYCISWWVLYSIYFKFGNKNTHKNYSKDGVYGFIISLIYFIIFTFLYMCVSNLKLGSFTISNLTGLSRNDSSTPNNSMSSDYPTSND